MEYITNNDLDYLCTQSDSQINMMIAESQRLWRTMPRKFSLANFKKLEGVYIPASSSDDVPTVGINANRPITRQRFSDAHELCHHFRDADKHISCPIGSKNAIERFAEGFAAALLLL